MSTPQSAREIAQEIARTRQRLSRSLARLDREYALRHLVVRVGRLVRSAEKPALGEALRHDAVPLALVALGLGWLSVASRRDGGTGTGLVTLLGAFERLQRMGEELGLLPRRPTADAAAPIASPPDHIGLS
jgi:hypothetical protein